MKLHYYPETDTLYMDFRDEPSTQSEEIAHDVVVDYGADGAVVGIGIDLASTKVDLATVEIRELPNVRIMSGASPLAERAPAST